MVIEKNYILDIEGMYIHIIKVIDDKPTGNIILNGAKLKAFPIRSGIKKSPFSSLLFNIVLEVLVRQLGKKRNKRHPNWKGRSKTVFICR